MGTRALVLLGAALFACDRGRADRSAPAPLLDAAPPTVAPAPDSGAGPVVDLLLETDASVVVSSSVGNGRDHPEHLVDGRPETAWNGKTGDLHGFVEITLPSEVRVDSLAITAGFDKKTNKGEDLFWKNHRIKRIRVSRGGVPLKEVALDTSERALQYVPLGGVPGGTFRIDVLETVPGTEPRWQELTVSDLKLFGGAGAARLAAPRVPVVSVAAQARSAPAAPEVDAPIEGRTAPSLGRLCAEWEAIASKAGASIGMSGPFCQDGLARVEVTGTLPPSWKALRIVTFTSPGEIATSSHVHVVVEARDGAVRVGPRLAVSNDLGCPSAPSVSPRELALVLEGGAHVRRRDRELLEAGLPDARRRQPRADRRDRRVPRAPLRRRRARPPLQGVADARGLRGDRGDPRYGAPLPAPVAERRRRSRALNR